MGIIIDQNTNVVILGMTGKEGSRAAKEMIEYGTKVSCGVTPGKGGMIVENTPIFDSVKEAKSHDSTINTAVLFVPPLMVYDAAIECMKNGIKTVAIVTENVPIKDSAKLFEWSQFYGCRMIGPSSIGVLTLGTGKIGSVGSESKVYSKGNIGIISKSGGLCSETAAILTQAGIGQSTVVGIGGDVIAGSTFTDMLELFQDDKDTQAVVIIGEIGGTYEEQVAEMIKNGKFTKPLVAFISGKFAQSLQRELSFGHAGAIIEHGAGNAEDKKQALKQAGALVADFHDEIPDIVRKTLARSM